MTETARPAPTSEPSAMDPAGRDPAPTPARPMVTSSDSAVPDGDRQGALATLREVAHDLRHSRDLLQQLTLRDVRIRYKQAVMGFGWAVFMPILVVLAGFLVRFGMSQVAGTDILRQQIAGMLVKSIGWAFFVGAIGFATPSLIGSQGLVTKVYFPREVLPLSAVLAQTFDSAIGVLVVLAILPFLGGITLGPQLAWAPVLALLVFLFTAASGLFLSCANLFFRDVKYIVQVLLTFGIFFTPIFFEPEMYGALGARVVMLNPLAPLLEGLRLSIVVGHDLLEPLHVVTRQGETVLAWSPWYLAYSTVWAVGGLLASLVIFRKASIVFAEYV